MKELKIGIYSIPLFFINFVVTKSSFRFYLGTCAAVKLILINYLMLNLFGFYHGNLGGTWSLSNQFKQSKSISSFNFIIPFQICSIKTLSLSILVKISPRL